MSRDGILLVDKEPGCTSHDVVAKVRRCLNQREVGHAGTLDPFASGLLVLLLGQATKISNYVLNQDKRYLVTIRLGQVTNTGDRTGEILSETPLQLSDEVIREKLELFQGDMNLKVPQFAAVKVAGKKLYEYARAGEEAPAPVKAMRFYDLKIVEGQGERWVVEVSCSKGAYIRAWVPAFGESLGVGAHVSELRRLVSTPFAVNEAISISKLEANRGEIDSGFVPLERALPELETFTVRGREEQLLRNGQISKDLSNRLILVQKRANSEGQPLPVKIMAASGGLLGLLEAVPGQGLKIRRIFANYGS